MPPGRDSDTSGRVEYEFLDRSVIVLRTEDMGVRAFCGHEEIVAP
ncbi:MAG TPA: hypothetical protein VFH50_11280 [Acidimicrobiales bacterium]|nr:hypothetical protein [Acidimicrobiales bacterium]